MGIAPAGEDRENTGHHHLLIDAELPSLDQPIPNDANHLHFDAGETEAEITLAPGTHSLQLLLGDKDHIAHNPPVMSLRIRVVASEGGAAPAAAGTPSAQRKTLPSPDALRRQSLKVWSVICATACPTLAISSASEATNIRWLSVHRADLPLTPPYKQHAGQAFAAVRSSWVVRVAGS